jgi:diguanylate cyclase (GGDEF)-like protein
VANLNPAFSHQLHAIDGTYRDHTGTPAMFLDNSDFESGTLREDDGYENFEKRSVKRGFLSVIRSRADIGFHTFLDSKIVIGRHASCCFPLRDLKVSGQHASIAPTQDGDFIIEDLQSTNGTRIDGKLIIGQQKLRDGEKIIVGETVIRFSLADKFDIDFHSEVATLVGTDPLTDLPSKRRFDESLDFAIQTSSRQGIPLAVLMMDMDGVKQINDTHGHIYGAHVIGETGRLIASVIGSKGQACRFGGDEFSAFLPGLDLVAATSVGEKIRSVVERAGFKKNGISLCPTISIGVSSYPAFPAHSLSLISAADEALYRAKAQGKNRVAA